MKKDKYLATCLILGLLVFSATADASSGNSSEKRSAAVEKESEHKKMIQRGLASDSDNTDILAPLVGEWRYVATFWSSPEAEGMRSDGQAKNEMVLNDRYLSGSVVGTLNIDGNETPIKGQGMIGYDSTKKAFTSVWADTLSPGMMLGKGSYDAKTKSIKETGQFINPLTGTQDNFSSQLDFTGPDTYKKTLYVVGKSGKQAKLMEIEYTRSKGAGAADKPETPAEEP